MAKYNKENNKFIISINLINHLKLKILLSIIIWMFVSQLSLFVINLVKLPVNKQFI